MPQRDDDFSLDDFDVEDGDTKVNVPSDATDDELAAFDAEGDEPSSKDAADLLGLTGDDDEIPAPPPKRATKSAAKAKTTAVPKAAPVAAPPAAAAATPDRLVNIAADVPVQVVAVLGKKNVVLSDLLGVRTGEIFEFASPLTTMVDLVANGKLFARGELVEIEGAMGVRIVQLMK